MSEAKRIAMKETNGAAKEPAKANQTQPALPKLTTFRITIANDVEADTYSESIGGTLGDRMFAIIRLLQEMTHGDDTAVTQICRMIEKDALERNRKQRTNGAFSGNLDKDFL